MNAQRRWYELLLHGMAVILVLAAGTVKTANADGYVQDPWEKYEYYSPRIRDFTESHQAEGKATAKADGQYKCVCTAEAYAIANDDRADASANSQASWFTDWTWDGPPESNPPGGKLTWTHDAYGESTGAWGWNITSGISISGADGDSWTYAEDDSAYADIDCFGYVMYGDTADGYADRVGYPPESFDEGSVVEVADPPNYAFAVDGWSLDTEGEDDIDPGTTYFYFVGGVTCDVDTTTISTEETLPWAHAYADAKAKIEFSAEFVSN
jgi:hypothetical protein